MEVEKTDEWKDWLDMKETREVEKISSHAYPIFLTDSLQWMVYHPYTNLYMLVDHFEYRNQRKTRYDIKKME